MPRQPTPLFLRREQVHCPPKRAIFAVLTSSGRSIRRDLNVQASRSRQRYQLHDQRVSGRFLAPYLRTIIMLLAGRRPASSQKISHTSFRDFFSPPFRHFFTWSAAPAQFMRLHAKKAMGNVSVSSTMTDPLPR